MRGNDERDDRQEGTRPDSSAGVPLMPSSEETEEKSSVRFSARVSPAERIRSQAEIDLTTSSDYRNRIIAESIESLADEGKKVTVPSVVDRLRATGNEEPSTPNVRAHLTNLSVRSALRNISDLGDATNELAEQRARRIAIEETEYALEELRSNITTDPMALTSTSRTRYPRASSALTSRQPLPSSTRWKRTRQTTRKRPVDPDRHQSNRREPARRIRRWWHVRLRCAA